MTVEAPLRTVDQLLEDARCSRQAGLYEQARRLLVDATCVEPQDARPLVELGDLLAESDPEQALRWFRLSLELEPEAPAVHARLAQLLASQVRSTS